MKRYFIGKKEISKSEAIKIETRNKEIMQSGDFNAMLEIQFIVAI